MHPVGLLVAAALLPAASSTTALVNDPAHPFTTQQWGKVERMVRAAHVPTDPGTLLISNQKCPDPGGLACSVGRVWDGMTWQNTTGHMWFPASTATMVFDHELGRMYRYHVLTARDEQALDAEFHVNHWVDPNTDATGSDASAGENVSADAYAECAMHATWPGPWWPHYVNTRYHGHRGAIMRGEDTPYRFRAGPARFARICAIYRTAATHGAHGYNPYT